MPIIVSNVYPPDRGGIQTMMAALADVAARAGSSAAVVVAPREAGDAAYDDAAPYRILRYPNRKRPFDALALASTYLRALRSTHHRTTLAANWWPSGLALALIPRFVRGRLAVYAHGSDVAPEKGGLRKAAMRFVYARCDAVLANSAFTQGLLASAGVTRRVHVVPLGVDVAPIEPQRSDYPTILSVGRLVERKGFDRIIAALAGLAVHFPAIRYEIVGGGPYRAELERLAAECGVRDRVVFHGALSQTEMERAYARAWCFALPVRKVGSDVEGFGIVYLEAAMARLPAIGGRYSGASDAIEDGVTGFLIDGNDATAVGDAIARVLSDPDAARRMGDRAFERAQTFTWQRCYDATMAALEA